MLAKGLTRGLSTLALIIGSSAHAQTADRNQVGGDAQSSGGLQEIVVTAQKRTENLQDVPIAVTAVSSSQLAAAGVLNTAALGGAVAGVSVNTTASYFAPHIRGVGTGSFGPGVENPVALYVDNVYYASQLTAPSDLSDVEQLAVLKGPQGTLFGRNATAGVIQMTTRNPSHDFGGEFKTELDNYLTSRNFLYLTGGLSDDVAANLSLKFAAQGDGWGKNLITGNDNHKINHDFSVRNKWTLNLSDQTTVRLNLDYTDKKDSMGPNIRAFPGGSPFLPGIGTTIFPSNIYDTASHLDNRNKVQSGGAAATLEQETGFGRIVSVTAYRKYKFDTIFDADTSPMPLTETAFIQRGKQFSQEIQLVSNDDQRLTWTIGGYYFRNSERLNGPVAVVYAPFLAPPPLTGVNTQTFDYHVRTNAESLAWFGQATFEVVPGTRVTGGLRYTYERRTLDGSVDFLADDVRDPTFDSVASGRSVSNSQYTWRLALDQDFGDHIMGYVSWNRGYKSGGFNALGTDLNDQPYQPEKLDAYEAGFKTELFDRRIRLNPAVFYYKYSQIQVTQFQANATFIRNAAKAELYGFDLDAEWKASDALSFNGGLEWIHSEFKSFPNAPSFDVAGGYVPINIDASGKQLPFTPRFTANIGATYTAPVGESALVLNVNNAYNSGYAAEPDNVLRQKSFNLLNASATFNGPGDSWSIGVFGRNLLNKRVVSQLSSIAFVGAIADYANPPRTYGVTLRYKFGG